MLGFSPPPPHLLLRPRIAAVAVAFVSSFSRKIATMAEPICPVFVPLEKDIKNASNDFKFRLISYNILAQVYVKSSYFPHSPSSCLKWKTRSQAILTHLKNLAADFLCVQELDEYTSFYKSKMDSMGYSSLYIQRSGQKCDGCGIFYRSSSSQLIQMEEINYNDLVSLSSLTEKGNSLDMERGEPSVKDSERKYSHADRGDTNDPQVRLKRDCVGLLAAFKLNDSTNHIIVVANTHIYWDPSWKDVKLAQSKYLLLRLSQFLEVISEKFSCKPSVVLAGDFNSTPGDEVYQYLTSASDATPIRLSSLYATNGGEPAFTNCTPDFTGTLDYIFVSGYRIKPVSLLQVPGPDSVGVQGGLPNHIYPSDHLPIGADFVLLPCCSNAI